MSFISNIKTSVMAVAAAAALTGCIEEKFNTTQSAEARQHTDKIVNTSAEAEEGELLVCLSTSAAATVNAGGTSAVQDLEGLDITDFKPVFHFTEDNLEFARKYTLDRWYKVKFEGACLNEAAVQIAQLGEVSKVQFNKKVTFGSDTRATKLSADGEVEDPLNPRLKDQWNLINTGRKTVATSAVEGADIALKDVWEKLDVRGSKDIIVAIIDGAVKHTHEDLEGNMWVNQLEKIGEPEYDDDGNGYDDDVYGWNCDRDTCKIDWTAESESGHGTHVAGIVGAVNNNGKGVCGVAGGKDASGDGVRLMSCQIFTGGVSSNASSAALAFVYAADNGANIAQCSFGYQNSQYESDFEYFYEYQLEYFAIMYFLDKTRYKKNLAKLGRTSPVDGPLAIFACGNDGFPRSSYPGAMMDCICVTSIGPDGMPAYYTNFGPGCNIAAPGGDYYLNTNGKAQVLSTFVSEVKGDYGDYTYMGGTSQACPHVSGVAALGLEYAARLGKTYTREEFTSLLMTSVNDIDSRLCSGYKFMGYDQMTGSELAPRPYSTYQYNMGTGTIDAWKFMMNIEGTPCLMVKAGEEGRYDLSDFFGGSAENLSYRNVNISSADMRALGVSKSSDCKIVNGKLSIYPTKVGSGKIRISAIAGGDTIAGNQTVDWTGNGDRVTIPKDNDKMGGFEITREISIVSRGVASKNGGWL